MYFQVTWTTEPYLKVKNSLCKRSILKKEVSSKNALFSILKDFHSSGAMIMVPKVRMVDGGEDGDCTRAEAEAGPGVLELSRPRRSWICRLCGKIRTRQRKLSIHKCDHHRHPKQSIYSCLFSVYITGISRSEFSHIICKLGFGP